MTAVSTVLKGTAFSRYAQALAVARGDPINALGFAEGQRHVWRDTPETLLGLKSTVDAMTTNDPGALGAPRAIVSDFMALVRPRSLLDRITGWRRVPMNVNILLFTGDATAYVVPEGAPKPLSKFSLARVTLTPQKIPAISVLTDETLKNSNGLAENSIGQELAKALGTQLDRRAFDPNLGGSIAANGTIINSSGSTLAAVDADLKLMIAVFANADAALDSAVFVMSATTAAFLGSLRGSGGNAAFPLVGARGGSILQIPVFVSSAMRAVGSPGESQIVLVDPTQVLLADDGVADVSLAKHASIQMDDAPSAAASQTISLWQANLVALRAERELAWKTTSTSAAAVLDNVSY